MMIFLADWQEKCNFLISSRRTQLQ